MTPAQASGAYDFVNDYPVQGPTDPGIRAADCWYRQNVLPQKSKCCGDGPIPIWAREQSGLLGQDPLLDLVNSRDYTVIRGDSPAGIAKKFGVTMDALLNANPQKPTKIVSGVRTWQDLQIDEGLFLPKAGVRVGYVAGVGQAAAGDIFATLSPAQQSWVQNTLSTLNSKILTATNLRCPTWAAPTANLAAAVGCFQTWANGLQVPLTSGGVLRTDGVFDQASLTALLATVAQHPEDFSVAFPPGAAPAAAAAVTAATAAAIAAATPAATAPVGMTEHKGLSTGAMIGLAAVGATVVGGGIYLATRGAGKGRGRRR